MISSNQEEAEIRVELKIPTHFGYEKVAMAVAAALGREAKLSEQKIEDLSTALAEAILNAMEHGNRMDQHLPVTITFCKSMEKLSVSIQDQGQGFIPSHPQTPNITDKLNGHELPRGWGWFLIQQLVDRLEVNSQPGRGTVVQLEMLLEEGKGRSSNNEC